KKVRFARSQKIYVAVNTGINILMGHTNYIWPITRCAIPIRKSTSSFLHAFDNYKKHASFSFFRHFLIILLLSFSIPVSAFYVPGLSPKTFHDRDGVRE